MKRYF
jgi:N-acetyl-anhydromuramyl-L-alanine amidase AmpD